jgi:hypothetical protein
MTITDKAKETENQGKPQDAASGCCGGPAPKSSSACCVLDAEVKAAGGSGCGCATKPERPGPAKKGCC